MAIFTILIMSSISLNDVKMNVISTAKNGVVNDKTIFQFKQDENVVTAHYAGGKIRKGFLVGVVAENHLSFSYCQIQTDNRLDNGISNCEISVDIDGKIMLIENFEWASRNGEVGKNIFKQL